MWKQFCTETTMHGFREMHETNSKIVKLFWMVVLLIGTTMTSYQIYIVVNDFSANPTVTQVILLPQEVEVQYPKISFTFKHFVEWINLTKVYQLNFDLNSFLYTVSYFCKVHTRLYINVTDANEKLKKIMIQNGITSLYDLGLKISVDHLKQIQKQQKFTKLFTSDGVLGFILNTIAGETNSSWLAQISHYSYYKIRVKTFSNFEFSLFNKQFLKYYNYSLSDEYRNFYSYVAKYYDYTLKNPLSSFPFNVNPSESFDGIFSVDVSQSNYEFRLKGTYFNWHISRNKNCKFVSNFDLECVSQCWNEYRLASVTNCQLYFVPNKLTETENEGRNFDNLCYFDQDLLTDNQTGLEICVQNCSSGCKRWKYDVSQTIFPKQIDDRNASNDVSGYIGIIYDNRENMLMISQVPSFTWDDALANIGGLLGLWLGGSLISFIQIFYFFCCIPMQKSFSRKLISRRNNVPINLMSYNNSNLEMSSSAEVNADIKVEKIQQSDNVLITLCNQQTEIISNLKEMKIDIHKTKETVGKLSSEIDELKTRLILK